MTPRLLRRSVLSLAALLATLLLTPSPRAGDPLSSAFRKAAKGAEKSVKAASAGEVKGAKAALAELLKAYAAGESDFAESVAGSVHAVTTAVARTNSAALAQALLLVQDGVELLDGYSGPLPDDLRDGGGGAWDDFKQRAEAQLTKTDAKLEALFAKFMKGAVKQAGKADHDPDPRWRLRGHADVLGGVEGPYLASLTPPVFAGGTQRNSQIVLEVRFLSVEDQFLQEIGVDFRGLGMPTLEVTEGDGSSSVSDPLVADMDGVIRDTMPLTRSTPQPLLTRLVAADESILDETVGSVPGNLPTPKDIVKQWAKRLKKEAAFAGKELSVITKQLKQTLANVLESQKQGTLTVTQALDQATSALRGSLGNDCFWLDAAMGGPSDLVAGALDDMDLADESVDAQMHPDGQGAYTQALAKLTGKAAKADAKRAKLFEQFGAKLDKQNKDVGITLDVVPSIRPDQSGIQIDILGQDFEVEPDLGQVVSGLAHIEGASPPFRLLSAGLAKGGLAGLDTSLIELPDGDAVALGGLISELSGATETKVPLLGELPVAGWLFRSQADGGSKRNLTVFVTPTIVVDDEGL